MPDTTLDWLLDAQNAVSRAGDEKESQERFETLVELDARLGELHARTQVVNRAASAIRKFGWRPDTTPNKVANGLESLAKDPFHRLRSSTLRDLSSHLDKVETDLKRAWKAEVGDRAGQVGELQNLAQALAGSADLAVTARNIENVLSDLNRPGKLPDEQSVASLERVSELLAELSIQVPPAVRDFLNATTRDGADLDMLSTEVIDWLRTNDVAAQFRVVTKKRGTPRG